MAKQDLLLHDTSQWSVEDSGCSYSLSEGGGVLDEDVSEGLLVERGF